MYFIRTVIFVLLMIVQQSVLAEQPIRVAVAANFLAAMKALAKDFTAETRVPVSISNGATGMLYAQIRKGAPYDVFFAADAVRPQRLEKEGKVEVGSCFTYVTGRLVVWSPKGVVSPDLSQLKDHFDQFRFIAIANPKTAPYGVAAQQVLMHYGLYQRLRSANKIALGENVGKTFHYAVTGNAQLALVAKSYVSNPQKTVGGKVWHIDEALYQPIKQQAVILKGKNRPTVQKFMSFMQSERARQKMAEFGYGLPEA